MKDSYAKPLSDDERQQLKPALDKVEQAIDELDGQLAALGRPPRDDGEDVEGPRCLVPGCRCRSFTPRPHSLLCATPGCGHRFTRHDVF